MGHTEFDDDSADPRRGSAAGDPSPMDRCELNWDDLAGEFRALGRSYDGVVQQFRIEALAKRLDRVESLAASHSWNGFCGDRVTMWLDDGSVLKLSLFWPIRRSIAALRRVHWSSHVGWIVDVRTTDGEDRRLYAFKARLTPARAA